MSRLISESEQKARKNHRCNACDFLINDVIGNIDFNFAEYRIIAKAKRNKWLIQKGDVYLKQSVECDGEIYTVKMIPEIHDLCVKYDLYKE